METLKKRTLISTTLLLLIFTYFHEVSAITQDLGRHLLFGEIILKTHSVPKINLLSYTHSSFPFINHHWLSEVIFTLVFKTASFEGLLILTTTTALAAFLAVFVFAIRKGTLGPTVFAALVYLPILAERTDVRPEVFSFLFLSLFMVILYTYRTRNTRWIFMLPFIELL